jgi:hypothetical protein
VHRIKVSCVAFLWPNVLISRLLWLQILSSSSLPALPDPAATTQAYFDGLGRVVTPVYMLDDLVGGQQLPGPALLIDNIRCAVAAGIGPAGGLYHNVRPWIQMLHARREHCVSTATTCT